MVSLSCIARTRDVGNDVCRHQERIYPLPSKTSRLNLFHNLRFLDLTLVFFLSRFLDSCMSLNRFRLRMAEEISKTKLGSSASVSDSSAASAATNAAKSRWKILWPSSLRWIPTSTDNIIAAENRLLSILKYVTFMDFYRDGLIKD